MNILIPKKGWTVWDVLKAAILSVKATCDYEQILASGTCDVCKEQSPRLELLLHEATRGGCWSTQDEQKALRKKAISVGY